MLSCSIFELLKGLHKIFLLLAPIKAFAISFRENAAMVDDTNRTARMTSLMSISREMLVEYFMVLVLQLAEECRKLFVTATPVTFSEFIGSICLYQSQLSGHVNNRVTQLIK